MGSRISILTFHVLAIRSNSYNIAEKIPSSYRLFTYGIDSDVIIGSFMGQGIQIRLYRMRSRHLSDKLHDGCQNDVKCCHKKQWTRKNRKGRPWLAFGIGLVSHQLFNILLELVMAYAKYMPPPLVWHGVHIQGQLVINLRFADDIALLAESNEVNEVYLYNINLGLKINIAKTEVHASLYQ